MHRPTFPLPSAHGSVAVLIVNYNSGSLLRRALASLERQTRPPQEVIVVDNGSCDGSADDLHMVALPGLRLIRLTRNIGFAAGSNLAAGETKADWLAMLNCDAAAEPDWLERLAAAAARHPSCGVFASLQFTADGTGTLDGAGDVLSVCGMAWRGAAGRTRRAIPREGRCFGACAAGAFVARRLYEHLGGFEPSFFCYLEDVDFAYRAQTAGAGCVFVPDAAIRHHGAAIAGRHSNWTLRISARNRLLLLLRNTPLGLAVLTAPFLLFGLLMGLAQGVRHGKAGAVLKGYADSLRDVSGALEQRAKLAPPFLPPWSLLRCLHWNPLAVLTRPASVWPVPRRQTPAARRDAHPEAIAAK